MITFYRGPIRLPGFASLKCNWTTDTEDELLTLLPSAVKGAIAAKNVCVVIPKRLPPASGGGVNLWETSVAAILQVEGMEEETLLAFSIDGVRKFITEVNATTTSPERRERIIMGVIIHELTHLEQHRNHRLRQLPEGQVFWEGCVWSREKCDEVGYIDLPWEREAFNAQFSHITHGDRTGIAILWDNLKEASKANGGIKGG